MAATVGVDLGGTNVAAALVDDGNRVLAAVRVPTPRDGPQAVVEAIVGLIAELGEDAAAAAASASDPPATVVGAADPPAAVVVGAPGPPAAVAVGAPGPVKDGVVLTAPNLPGWGEPVPLGLLLGDRLGVPVVVDNDANVGTVGEWVAGAGRGARCLLGVWLGTGVGGGLVLDGRPYRGAFGGAGEFGHMCVVRGGAECGCGRRGCVEAYAGRAAMEAAVARALADGRRTALEELRAERGKERITAGIWAAALGDGDPLATELVDEAVDALGAAVASVVNLLDLDRIVVGGGLTEKLGQPFVDRIAEAARPGMLVPDLPRPFRAAALGDDSGVVGAAALARQVLNAGG